MLTEKEQEKFLEIKVLEKPKRKWRRFIFSQFFNSFFCFGFGRAFGL